MSFDFFEFMAQSKSAASDYVKFQDGDKRSLRLLSKPIGGYELFVEGKPVRWRHDEPRPEHAISDEKPKRFVAFVAFEYDKEVGDNIKVWSISQRTIKDQLKMLFKGIPWTTYELVVSRVGKGLDTHYNVTGIKSPLEENLRAFAFESSKYIDLDKLFTGENPFLQDLPALSVAQDKPQTDDLPF